MANLSATQLRYLANAWLCFESEPKIDYTRFATLSGLKSAASAREMLRQTKKKLLEHGCASASLTTTTTTTTTTNGNTNGNGNLAKNGQKRGRKTKTKVSEDDDDNNHDEHDIEDEDDGGDGDGVGSRKKPKRTMKKPKTTMTDKTNKKTKKKGEEIEAGYIKDEPVEEDEEAEYGALLDGYENDADEA